MFPIMSQLSPSGWNWCNFQDLLYWPNLKMYVFGQIWKCICQNLEKYYSKFENRFVPTITQLSHSQSGWNCCNFQVMLPFHSESAKTSFIFLFQHIQFLLQHFSLSISTYFYFYFNILLLLTNTIDGSHFKPLPQLWEVISVQLLLAFTIQTNIFTVDFSSISHKRIFLLHFPFSTFMRRKKSEVWENTNSRLKVTRKKQKCIF